MSVPLLLAQFPFQNLILGILLGVPLLAVPVWWLKREVDEMVAEEKKRSRSPFSEKLIRPAGESLRLKIDEIRDEMLSGFVTLALVLCIPGFIAILASSVWFPVLIVCTAVAAAICFGFARRKWEALRKLRKKLRNYRLGFDGERYVAAELEPLIARGYRVFHDFVFDIKPGGEDSTFNIDHIAVGPEGVFVIETKAKRKMTEPSTNDLKANEMELLGTTLRFPDGSTTDAPIQQAKRQAKEFERWISKSGIGPIEVRPVVVFPGWFIKSEDWKRVGVQSASKVAERIPALGRGRRLSPSEISQIAARIEDRCRDIEGE